MTLDEQRQRADEDGWIATICPQCRHVDGFNATALVGVKSRLTHCECGCMFTNRGYGKLPRRKRRKGENQ